MSFVLILSWQVALHHHFIVCRRWRKQTHLVKIIYMSPVPSQRTLRTQSIASYKSRISASRLSRGSLAGSLARVNESIAGSNLSIPHGGLNTPRSSISTSRSSVSTPRSSSSINNSTPRSIGSPQSSISPSCSPEPSQNSNLRSPTRVSFDTSLSYDTFRPSARASENHVPVSRVKQARLSQPTVVAVPFLRPILKYSNRLQASSWQSLNDIEDAIIMENRAIMELGLPPDYIRVPWRRNASVGASTGDTDIFRTTLPLPQCFSTTLSRETCVWCPV